MRKPAFQDDDPASSAGNARVNADVSSHGALAVSAYLRRRLETFPEAARPHLESAARRYDRIAGLLGPFAVWEEGKGYRALMGRTGDVEKQKAHAESVLVPVKRELAAAADEIEKALLAEMSGRLAGVDLSGRGSGFERDTFCLAVQEAARILGRPVDYETLLALTTNAFAPGFDTGNDCKELWVANAWVSHLGPLDTAWRHLGLRVEPLLHPGHRGDPATPGYRQTMVGLVRAAMAEGKAVVSCGGWDFKRTWVEPWWAGIVTEARDDGTVLGAHLNGRNDNVLKNLNGGELLAVSLTEPSLSVEESNVELLRHAVNRIRAKGKPGSFGRHEFCAFGVDAMDDWIAQIRDVPHFCPPCQKNKGTGHGSAFTVARAVLHRSDEAAAFLRARAGTFPGPARPHVEAAAGRYERIVSLLRPATTPGGNEHYKTFIGDIDKQKAHAEGVLVPVKRELAAAADEMEKALGSVQKAKVKRAGNRVWIEGVERLTPWGHGRDCSYMDALAVAMRAIGKNTSYDRLMGASGMAFRLQIRHPEWCTKTLDAGVGFDATDPAWQALGYSGKSVFTREGNAEDREKARRAIVDSIDRGRPVIAMDLEDGMNWGVVAGYVDDGRQLLCRTKSHQEGDLLVPRKWPWLVNVVVGETPPPDHRETIIASLRRAMELARTERYAGAPPGKEHYLSGFAGYRKWMEALRDERAFDGLAPGKLGLLCRANCECYTSLLDARRIAAAYVRSSANGLEDAAKRPLLRAADHYESLVRELEEGRA
ncbi:MAG: hypothetical protein ACYSU0_19590, partial [Planctomycetota bacterium]